MLIREKMGLLKVRSTEYEVAKYDGHSDYVLWEKQVKGMLYATRLGKLLRAKQNDVCQEDLGHSGGARCVDDYSVSSTSHHQTSELDFHSTCTSLFDALQN